MIKAEFVEVIVHKDLATRALKHVLAHEVAVLEEVYGQIEVVGTIDGSIREVEAEVEYHRLERIYGNKAAGEGKGGESFVSLVYGRFKSGEFEKALKSAAPKSAKVVQATVDSIDDILRLSIADAKTHIAALDRNQCEVLLAAEKANDERKGMIDALEERIGELVTA